MTVKFFKDFVGTIWISYIKDVHYRINKNKLN